MSGSVFMLFSEDVCLCGQRVCHHAACCCLSLWGLFHSRLNITGAVASGHCNALSTCDGAVVHPRPLYLYGLDQCLPACLKSAVQGRLVVMQSFRKGSKEKPCLAGEDIPAVQA